MVQLTPKDLLKARVHLGHLSKKWNPYMAPFILMQSNKKHVIDLNKTLTQLAKASDVLRTIAKSGKKILFVATKKQAKEMIKQTAETLNMPYMTERWLGGTLTNFITIRKLTKKIASIDKMMQSTSYMNMAKKERLMISRDKVALERILGGMLDLTRLPGALVVVDIMKEHIAVQEANKLGIPVIALVDTNSNPNLVTHPIPSNDDATTSISIIVNALKEAIAEGLAKREEEKVQHPIDVEVKHEPSHHQDVKHESFHHRFEKRNTATYHKVEIRDTTHQRVEKRDATTHHKGEKQDILHPRFERRDSLQQRVVKRALSYHKGENIKSPVGLKTDVNTKVEEPKAAATQLKAAKATEDKVAKPADTKAKDTETKTAKVTEDKVAKPADTKAKDTETKTAKAVDTKAKDVEAKTAKATEAKATKAVDTKAKDAEAKTAKVTEAKATKAAETKAKATATKAAEPKATAEKAKTSSATKTARPAAEEKA